MKCPSKTFTEEDMPSNLCPSLCAGLCRSQKSCPRVRFGLQLSVQNKQIQHNTKDTLPPPNTQNCEGGLTLEGFHIGKRKNFSYIGSPILNTMHSWKCYHQADHQKGKCWLYLLLSFNKHLLNIHYVPGTTVSSAMFTLPKTSLWIRRGKAV